jgi:glucokinase
MRKYMGIDVGGNHVKMGIVDEKGALLDFQSLKTAELREDGDFVSNFLDKVAYQLINHKEINKIGIGLPGMLTKDRKVPLEIPAIPELNNIPLYDKLKAKMPNVEFFLENDANAAALGELLFSEATLPDTFAFITLGTGIGSAVILDRKIFTGGDGNGLELGHIPSRNGKRLEVNIGKQGIIDLAAQRLENYKDETVIPRNQPISATKLVVSAAEGDTFSKSVFYEVGEILGEGLVALIRIMDIKTIIIGGGLSAGFDFIKPGIEKSLNYYLSAYYLDRLDLRLAILGNDAGILGAASLCF